MAGRFTFSAFFMPQVYPRFTFLRRGGINGRNALVLQGVAAFLLGWLKGCCVADLWADPWGGGKGVREHFSDPGKMVEKWN